jgi:hypothetical protein
VYRAKPAGAPAEEPGQAVSADSGPTSALETLLADASVAGLLAHKLGPLAAWRLRGLGQPVPPLLEVEERRARSALMTAVPLLGRIRSCCEGTLLLLKGAEVAVLYPDRARSFVDIDLLASDPQAVYDALRANGFVEVDDPPLPVEHHHLPALQWPPLWLRVEIHLRPMWPDGIAPPPLEEIVEAAVPSRLGFPGISAPRPAHHALILAAHDWVHEPLHTLRDLLDIALVARLATDEELERTARAWRIERIWHTTQGAADALFAGGTETAALRLWGRHLRAVRERTVLDSHLQRWLHGFWGLPHDLVLRSTVDAFCKSALPEAGESSREKLTRVKHAVLHPRRPLSSHTATWQNDVEQAAERRSAAMPDPTRDPTL